MSAEFSLEELVAEVQASAKYAPIAYSLVERLTRQEMARLHNRKEIVKSVRNKLHQVGSAYQEKPIGYTQWLSELDRLPQELAAPESRAFCRAMMAEHTSTRERLPYLEQFYADCLAPLGSIHSLLDLACGLNPLALSWLPLAEDAQVRVCDVYTDQVAFLNAFFGHFGLHGSAETCDLTQSIPKEPFQLALLLKTIPCLEQIDKSIGPRLLAGLQAEYILVSFPAHSLGGKGKGMRSNYDAHFQQLIAGLKLSGTTLRFSGRTGVPANKNRE